MRGFEKARSSFGRVGDYKGMSDIFVKIWREEKVFGFYKGALPSLIKVSNYWDTLIVGAITLELV